MGSQKLGLDAGAADFLPGDPIGRPCFVGYFDCFSTLQFVFIISWFKVTTICHISFSMIYRLLVKVAESLLNPFGDDENDFDMNYIIDRNLKVV